MDADERTMMLRHEEEHLRAGDPRLVLFGALALVAVPWNAALWLMVHRMRLAIEVGAIKCRPPASVSSVLPGISSS